MLSEAANKGMHKMRSLHNHQYVIFSIDRVDNTHTLAKFLRHIDTQNALGNMVGMMVHCIGAYKGKLEQSFLMRREDYTKHVAKSGYIDAQESVLFIHGESQDARLHYLSGYNFELGKLTEVPMSEAMQHDSWTYVPAQDCYFICK